MGFPFYFEFVLDKKRSMVFRLAGLGSKILKFSFCTCSNDPRPRKIKENLRKLNKKRIDLVEIMSLNVVEEAVLQSGGPLAVLRLPVHHAVQVRGPVDLYPSVFLE